MSKKPNPTLVGAFILGGALLIAVAIALWGSIKLFQDRYRFVCYFDGSVNGLTVGAPVKYRGVSIGTVVETRLRFEQEPGDARIPVFIELLGKRLHELGVGDDPAAHGLRARLETMSLVTGQLYVNLDMVPDSKLELVQHAYPEIPTRPNKMEEATRSLASILSQLEQSDFKGIAKSLAGAVEGINQLVNTRDIRAALSEIPPTLVSLREAFDDLRDGINGVRQLITARGPIAMEMQRTLQDLQKAATSVRGLADYLQRNPNALIVGKKKEKVSVRVLLALTLCGCSVFKPVADDTKYYLLTEQPTPAGKMARASGAPSVGLERIELPEYLNRAELVARVGSNQLKIYESERWGEPIKEGIDRTLRRDLALLLGAERIDQPPWDNDGPPALVIGVELRRFERISHHEVELEASWVLRDGKSGKTILARNSRLRRSIDGGGTQASVDALSKALAALSAEIAVSVRSRR